MAPIYESDSAHERWSKTEWNHYELWEKVEVRLRRHKRLWVALTVVVFFALSSVPIVAEQKPKWMTLAAARRLGQEINQVKRDAGITAMAYRLRFTDPHALAFQVEKLSSCAQAHGEVVRTGDLLGPASTEYRLLTPEKGAELSIPGLIESFCYDPLKGSESFQAGKSIVGFGVVSVKDLAENRHDRISILLLSGVSAEVAFD